MQDPVLLRSIGLYCLGTVQDFFPEFLFSATVHLFLICAADTDDPQIWFLCGSFFFRFVVAISAKAMGKKIITEGFCFRKNRFNTRSQRAARARSCSKGRLHSKTFALIVTRDVGLERDIVRKIQPRFFQRDRGWNMGTVSAMTQHFSLIVVGPI